jgi:hypothetical protein
MSIPKAIVMARSKKEIAQEMREKNWDSIGEYESCRKNLRISKFKKYTMAPAWLVVLVLAAYFNCPAWAMVLASIPVFLKIRKIDKELDHRIRCSTLAMFCLEIEFGASKASDEPEMTEELIDLFRE